MFKNQEMSIQPGAKGVTEIIVDFDNRIVVIDGRVWVPFENVKHGTGGLEGMGGLPAEAKPDKGKKG